MIDYKVGDVLKLPTRDGLNKLFRVKAGPSGFTRGYTVEPFHKAPPNWEHDPTWALDFDSLSRNRNADYRWDFNFDKDLETILEEKENV